MQWKLEVCFDMHQQRYRGGKMIQTFCFTDRVAIYTQKFTSFEGGVSRDYNKHNYNVLSGDMADAI